MRALIVIVALALAGCATVPLKTASGKPETTIAGVNKKQVADTLTARMVDRGYLVKSANEYNVVFETKSKDAMTNAIYGSNWDWTATLRVNYNLLDIPGGVRVIGHPEIVTNGGMGFESSNDASYGKSGEEVNKFLDTIRQSLEKPAGASIS